MESEPKASGGWRDDLTKYYQMGTVAGNTLKILANFLDESDAPSTPAPETTLGAALEHLAEAREGFQLQLRTSEIASLSEMQYIVERALVDWQWLEELGWDIQVSPEVELPRDQVMAFTHAYVALATLPRLPYHRVTFPRLRRSYADIPVPTNSYQVLTRLEELEQVIYRVLSDTRRGVGHESLRRTYGFFETSAWLVSSHQKRFQA